MEPLLQFFSLVGENENKAIQGKVSRAASCSGTRRPRSEYYETMTIGPGLTCDEERNQYHQLVLWFLAASGWKTQSANQISLILDQVSRSRLER